MKIKNMKGLFAKVERLRHRFNRRKKVLEANGRQYDEVLSHAIWVYRRPLCRAMTRAILTLTNQHMGGEVGRTLWRWRSASVTSQMVSRVVIDLLLEFPIVTVSQVEAQCRREEIPVRRTLISKIMNQGADMKLFVVEKESRDGREYGMSDLAREELLDRMALKYTDPAVVAFARSVLMIAEMRKQFSAATEEREANPNPFDADASLFAMALRGDFDPVDDDDE